MDNTPKILQIAAAAVPGERRTFVNVYGLDDQSRVWQWNAKLGRWQPNKLQPKGETGNLDGRSQNGHDARGGF